MTTRDGRPYALQTKTGKEVAHGKPSSYTNLACRCEKCFTVISKKGKLKTEEKLKYRQNNSVEILPDGQKKVIFTERGYTVQHGIVNSYRAHGCRCFDCTNAHFAKRRGMSITEHATYLSLDSFIVTASGDVVPKRDGRGHVIKHGLGSTYTTHGCRCFDCSASRKKEQAEQRDRRRKFREQCTSIDPRNGRRLVNITEQGVVVVHGIPAGYVSHGCRCLECVAWKNNKSVEEYARNRPAALRRREKFFSEESNKIKRREDSKKYRKENKELTKSISRRGHEKRRQKNSLSKKSAYRQSIPWTAQDDAIVLDSVDHFLTALRLGKTYNQVQYRKVFLRKKLREQGIDPDTMQPLDNN